MSEIQIFSENTRNTLIIIIKLTCKGNGPVNGEDTGFAAVVTKLSVGITRKNLAAVTAEELDGLVGGDHASRGFG